MRLTRLDKACRIAIIECMAVKKSEKVLIVTDELTNEIGKALYLNSLNLGYETLYVEMKSWETHGQEPPRYVADLMKQFNVILLPTKKSLTHTNARRDASALGARVATFPGITTDVMIRGLSADYKKIAELTNRMKKIFEETDEVRITSPNGTDLFLKLGGRKAIASKGLFHENGESGNLPTGETFAAPIEGTTNGIFVVDGSMAGLGVVDKQPIKIVVENGYATKISGGTKAKKLVQILDKYDKRSRNIAELGIGANDKAKLSGNLLEDEKVLGTVHVALGNNITMGGNIDVPIHLDGVIKNPTVYFDGKAIMQNGKLLI